MAELSERARQVRKSIMDHTRGEGVVPTTAELCRELGLSADDLAVDLLNLEAAASVARQDSAHAGLTQFQDETLDEPLPPLGEIMYARPFAAFKNHYQVWVDGEQKWFAECAVEACSISAQFPGKEVTVRSVCRQTREPVELVGRDGVLLDYSPATLRVHLGYPLRTLPARIVGWCDYNSFFASEDAAQPVGERPSGGSRGHPQPRDDVTTDRRAVRKRTTRLRLSTRGADPGRRAAHEALRPGQADRCSGSASPTRSFCPAPAWCGTGNGRDTPITSDSRCDDRAGRRCAR